MEASVALDAIARHLLGDDYYCEYCSSDDTNDDIVSMIKKRYPAVDGDPVDRWRRRHKRCYFCTHCSITPSIPFAPDVYICEAKGKTVNIDTPRPFCTLFELKKEKKDNEH